PLFLRPLSRRSPPARTSRRRRRRRASREAPPTAGLRQDRGGRLALRRAAARGGPPFRGRPRIRALARPPLHLRQLSPPFLPLHQRDRRPRRLDRRLPRGRAESELLGG